MIMVYVDRTPGLRKAFERTGAEGFPQVILDGTVIPARRCREKTLSVRGEPIDVRYSGKAHTRGGNIQAFIAEDRFPLRVFDVSPAWCTTSLPLACTPCPRLHCRCIGD
jgi:hypothetical protein